MVFWAQRAEKSAEKNIYIVNSKGIGAFEIVSLALP